MNSVISLRSGMIRPTKLRHFRECSVDGKYPLPIWYRPSKALILPRFLAAHLKISVVLSVECGGLCRWATHEFIIQLKISTQDKPGQTRAKSDLGRKWWWSELKFEVNRLEISFIKQSHFLQQTLDTYIFYAARFSMFEFHSDRFTRNVNLKLYCVCTNMKLRTEWCSYVNFSNYGKVNKPWNTRRNQKRRNRTKAVKRRKNQIEKKENKGTRRKRSGTTS